MIAFGKHIPVIVFVAAAVMGIAPKLALAQPAQPAKQFDLQIVNETGKEISIYWVSAEDKPVFYKKLGPNQNYQQPTYVGHRWRAVVTGGDKSLDYPVTAAAATWRVREDQAAAAQKDVNTLVASGKAWVAKKDFDKAISDFNEALKLDPTDYIARLELSGVWMAKRDFARAIKEYDELLRLNPDNYLTAGTKGLRGHAYQLNGDNDRAIKDLDESIRLDRTSEQASFTFVGRGRAWENKKEYAKAIDDFTEAIRLKPKDCNAYFDRARVWLIKKDFARQIEDLDTAIRLEPNSPNGHNALAWTLATCPNANLRDGKKAVQLAKKACEMNGWKFGGFIDTLAAACAEAGQFDDAVKYQTQALQDPRYNGARGNALRDRLQLYEAKMPYYQGP